MTSLLCATLALITSMVLTDEPPIEGDPAHASSAPTTQRFESNFTVDDSETVSSILPRVLLTPREVRIVDLDNARIDLNGTWDFVRDVPASFDGRAESISEWKPVQIPLHFAFQGMGRMHEPDGVPVAYAKRFDVPSAWKDRRVVLRFEGVDGLTKLFVNGKRAGENDMACLPSEFDITPFVRVGETNQLTLTIEKSIATRWSRRELGGITRPVYVQALPKVALARLHVDTDLHPETDTATLRTHLRIANAAAEPARDVRVNVKLFDAAGTATPLNAKPIPLGGLAAGQTLEVSLPFKVASPKLWNAETPNLYVVEVELLADDAPTMSARQRFGFREVQIVGNQLLVNGVAVKLRGANYHITYPGLGESVPRDLIRKDLELLTGANLNAMRPRPTPSIDYLELCDEMGIYNTVEAMISLMIYDAGKEKDHGANPAIAPGLRRHIATMIESSYSHPSILTWGLGNECPYYDYFQTAAIGTRPLDPTRPLFFGSDNRIGVSTPFMDINDDHYPRSGRTTVSDPGAITGEGWDYPRDRPNIFTEWMHFPANNSKEIDFDPGVNDFWGYAAEAHIEKMFRTPEFAGGFMFKGVPYTPVGTGSLGGLFDEHRNIASIYWHNKKAHSPIRLSDRSGRYDPATQTARFALTNRFDFTDLNAITFRWQRGSAQGAAKVSVAPHASGEIEVPFDPAASTRLDAFDAKGRPIDSWTLSLADSPRAPATPPAVSGKWSVKETDADVHLSLGEREYQLDRKTGLLTSASLRGRKIIDGTPTLLVLPAQLRYFRQQQVLTLVNQASDWKANQVEIEQTDTHVTIRSRGTYKQLAGTFTTRIDTTGQVRIAYDFEWTRNLERPINCFSWGLALPVAAECDTFYWDRNAQWTAYPPGHIGRAAGEAKATGRPNPSTNSEPAATVPSSTGPVDWAQEIVDGVTRDFRGTRFYVYEGGLRDDNGIGVQVAGHGTQHLQAVPIHGDLDGQIRVRETHGERRPGWYLHVMPFHCGGTEPHMTKSLRFEVLDIQRGTRFKGEAVFYLLP